MSAALADREVMPVHRYRQLWRTLYLSALCRYRRGLGVQASDINAAGCVAGSCKTGCGCVLVCDFAVLHSAEAEEVFAEEIVCGNVDRCEHWSFQDRW